LSSCHPGWSPFKDTACGLIAFLAWNGVPPIADCIHPLTGGFLPGRAHKDQDCKRGMLCIMLIRLASHACIFLPQNALALAIIYAITKHETLAVGNQDVQTTGLCGQVILECCMGCMSAAKQILHKPNSDQTVLLWGVRSTN
jgi:hypothetical protein